MQGLREASPWLTPSSLCWMPTLLYLQLFSCKPASLSPAPESSAFGNSYLSLFQLESLLSTSLKEQRSVSRSHAPRTPLPPTSNKHFHLPSQHLDQGPTNNGPFFLYRLPAYNVYCWVCVFYILNN